jgi:hypothetical protein
MPRLPLPPKLLLLAAVLGALLFALGYLVYLAVRIAWIHGKTRKGSLQCPACGSVDLRHSHAARWPDVLYLLGACVPYRCRACRRRFFWPDDKAPQVLSKTAREESRRRTRRGQRVLLVTVLFCVPLLAAVPLVYYFRTLAFGNPGRPENGGDDDLVLSEASFQGAGAARFIHGSVRNLSSKRYAGVKIVFQLSDNARQRIGRVLAAIETVGPQATVSFRTGPVPEAAARLELRSIDGTPR